LEDEGRLGPNYWDNAFEWILVAFVLGYFLSFSVDWQGRAYQTLVVADLPPVPRNPDSEAIVAAVAV
jgi:hypothetical protein